MKKEIMALVNGNGGEYRINNIATLRRWTKVDDKQVDMLEIAFDCINNVNFGHDTVRINSRDYDGIIADCTRAINDHLNIVSNELQKNMMNGYRNV